MPRVYTQIPHPASPLCGIQNEYYTNTRHSQYHIRHDAQIIQLQELTIKSILQTAWSGKMKRTSPSSISNKWLDYSIANTIEWGRLRRTKMIRLIQFFCFYCPNPHSGRSQINHLLSQSSNHSYQRKYNPFSLSTEAVS